MKDHRTKACAVNSTLLESLNLPQFHSSLKIFRLHLTTPFIVCITTVIFHLIITQITKSK